MPSYSLRSTQVGIALLTAFGLLGGLSSALADDITRSGTKFIAESTEVYKTVAGKEVLRISTEYDWDSGLTLHHVYDTSGRLVETRESESALRPDSEELARAFGLVWEDREVRQIRRRQAGLEINGGFPYREAKGSCARPARCVQVFLFDGENVVKHMLVDLRTDKIVERDYVPPRNREQQQ